jgi:hypothetical protein
MTVKKFTDKQKSRVLSFGDEIVLSFGQDSGYLLVDGDVKKQAWIPPVTETGETTSHSKSVAAGCDVMKYVFRVEPPSFYKAKKVML